MSARGSIRSLPTEKTKYCGNCLQVEQPVGFWCTHCKLGLCSRCDLKHRSNMVTRKHEILSLDEYRKLLHNSNTREFCGLHGKKIDHYCVLHDIPCCATCIVTKHSKCQDIAAIDENLTELKTPILLSDLDKKCLQLLSDIETVLENRQQNIRNIENQKLKIQMEITAARQAINEFLDKIENETLVNLSKMEQKQKRELDNVMMDFGAIEKNINHTKEKINSIRKMQSDAKAFLETCEMQTKLTQQEHLLHRLYEDERLKQRDMELKFNSKFVALYTDVKSFGDIILKKTPVKIESFRRSRIKNTKPEVRQSVTVVGARRPTCFLTRKGNISVEKGKRDTCITSCAEVLNGKFVFVDCSDKRVIVCNEDGSHFRNIVIPNQPWDLAVVERNVVAVSVPLDHLILLMDVSTGVAVKRLDVKTQCYGIDFRDGKFFVICHRHGIKIIDLEGNIENTLSMAVGNVWYVAASVDRIFYSEWNTHTIYCCNREGKPLWKFTDENLRSPRAITYDEAGHVYVTGRLSNTVIAISPDGKQSKVLLTNSDGLDRPTGLYYDRKKRRLLLCSSFHGSVSYYKVSLQGHKSAICSIS